MNLAASMLERLEARGTVPFLEGDGGEHDGVGLAGRARGVAEALLRAGVEPGARVALCLPKGPALVTCHVGVVAAGAVATPLNPAVPDRALSSLIRRAEPALGIADAGFCARARVLTPDVPWWCAGEPIPDGCSALPDAQGSVAAVPRHADDPALLVFTSGTTGSPKGVPLSHGNLRSNLAALQRVWDWSGRDRLLHVLPVFHLHGLGVALYGSLLAGSAVVLHERFDPERVLAEAGRARISLLMAVPTLLHRLLEASERRPDPRLAGLRAVISGSAPLAPALFERFRERFGLEPVERYGMSETLMNASNPVHGVRKPGSVGPAVPGVEIRLREPVEGSGEVEVRGPNVFRGYWNDAEATAAAFDGEWFRTGDLGCFDDDGFLRLVGRVVEIIVTGGYNVSPLAVERALEECTGVAELAVAALPDTDLGERVAAFVVPKAGVAYDDLEGRLRARAEEELPRYAWPREYRFCESLPRNALGKLERARLCDRQVLRD